MSKPTKIYFILVTVLLLVSVLLGACTSPVPAPTASTPPEQTSPPPTDIPDVIQPVSQVDLVGVTWQWISLVETMPAAQSVVPDPENYTLTF